MYLTNSPFWLQWLYPTLTWHKNRKEKSIYLTFDDGPIPVVTPFVLNTLKKFNAKATFFCIGENIDKYPEIFADVISDGHTIGNHTYNHLKEDTLNRDNSVAAVGMKHTHSCMSVSSHHAIYKYTETQVDL